MLTLLDVDYEYIGILFDVMFDKRNIQLVKCFKYSLVAATVNQQCLNLFLGF